MVPVRHLPDAAVVELGASPCRTPAETRLLRERLVEAGRQAVLLVVDFSRVRFFGADLLGLLLAVTRELNARPDDVRLCGLDALAVQVLRATRLDTFWRTFPTAEEALAAPPLEPVPLIVRPR
jgi:anti-anti-sigma regulatory factor